MLFVDVETQVTDDRNTMLAIGDKRALRTSVVHIPRDARLKDPDKIAADDAAKAAREIEELASFNAAQQAAALDDLRKTALSASAGGRLFSIAAAVDDAEILRYDSRTVGEAAMLESFFRDLSCITIDEHRGARFMKSGLPPLERSTVVAHYAAFDIDFIRMRSKILKVPVPAWWPKNVPSYASEKVFDTMTAWAGVRDRISLNALCKLLGLPGKGWVDGGGVPEEEPVAVMVPMVTTISTIDPYSLFSDPLADDPMEGMPIDMTELADERDCDDDAY